MPCVVEYYLSRGKKKKRKSKKKRTKKKRAEVCEIYIYMIFDGLPENFLGIIYD